MLLSWLYLFSSFTWLPFGCGRFSRNSYLRIKSIKGGSRGKWWWELELLDAEAVRQAERERIKEPIDERI